MSTCTMPVRLSNWNKYVSNADKITAEKQNDVQKDLMHLAYTTLKQSHVISKENIVNMITFKLCLFKLSLPTKSIAHSDMWSMFSAVIDRFHMQWNTQYGLEMVTV